MQTHYNLISQIIFDLFRALKAHLQEVVVKVQVL
jgi:hypothetical protein